MYIETCHTNTNSWRLDWKPHLEQQKQSSSTAAEQCCALCRNENTGEHQVQRNKYFACIDFDFDKYFAWHASQKSANTANKREHNQPTTSRSTCIEATSTHVCNVRQTEHPWHMVPRLPLCYWTHRCRLPHSSVQDVRPNCAHRRRHGIRYRFLPHQLTMNALCDREVDYFSSTRELFLSGLTSKRLPGAPVPRMWKSALSNAGQVKISFCRNHGL